MSTPNSHQRIQSLDGLRGCAMLMVYVFHYGGGRTSSHALVRCFGYLVQTGWIGVVIFFALSGYLITGGLWDAVGQGHWLRNFYARRGLRILPLYYFALVLSTLVSLGWGAQFVEIKELFLYYGFLQNIPGIAVINQAEWIELPVYHLWSLAVEEQFYLFLPLFLMVARRARDARKGAIGLCFCVFGASWVFGIVVWGVGACKGMAESHQYDSFALTNAGALALGGALALAQRGAEWDRVQRWALPALWVSGLTYLFSSWYGGSLMLVSDIQHTVGLGAVSVAAVALVALVVGQGRMCKLFSFTVLGWFGRISYGFYVYHILLRQLYDHLGAQMAHSKAGMAYQAARMVVAFPITLAVSWLSYRYLESPILGLKSRFPLQRRVA